VTEWWGGTREHEEAGARWVCGYAPPPGPGEAECADQAKRGSPTLDYDPGDTEAVDYVPPPMTPERLAQLQEAYRCTANLKPVAL